MLGLVIEGVVDRCCCCLFVGRCFDTLGELFLDGPLSLRVDSSGRPKLPGFDFRLNLVHFFAAS